MESHHCSITVGRHTENSVENMLTQKGWRVVYRNKKFFGIELDRLMRIKNGDLVLLEIKSIESWDYIEQRVSIKQKRRLQALRSLIQGQVDEAVHLMYAFYSTQNQMLKVYTAEGDFILQCAEL